MNVVMSELFQPHLLTVDDYHRMGESGILAQDARVELINGVIIDMPPIGIKHASATDTLYYLLATTVAHAAIVRSQGPIQLGDLSEPVPDFAVLKARPDRYKNNHPRPDDVLLVVEVSDSSLGFDLNEKLSLYARHGIPEYWVVDLKNRQLRVFTGAREGAYSDVSIVNDPCVTPIGALPGVSVDWAQLFAD